MIKDELFSRRSFDEISRLETAIDNLLPDRRKERVSFEWIDAARPWTKAIWALAKAHGPSNLGEVDLAWGLAAGARPIFICGMQRSGTTLLRNLLDGHPMLSVLPYEGNYYTSVERKLSPLSPDDFAAAFTQLSLRRLANPINQPPYWLLGRSTATSSPYVDFAREIIGWLEAPRLKGFEANASWPLLALSLTCARCVLGTKRAADIRSWVDKTPGNERYLTRIWRDFSDAQVIQVIRRPSDIAASHAKLLRQVGFHSRQMVGTLCRQIISYAFAEYHVRRSPPERYCVVQYEQLIAEPQKVLSELANFLSIVPMPILHEPTVAGQAATNNSSFHNEPREGYEPLTFAERFLLRIAEWCYQRLLKCLS